MLSNPIDLCGRLRGHLELAQMAREICRYTAHCVRTFRADDRPCGDVKPERGSGVGVVHGRTGTRELPEGHPSQRSGNSSSTTGIRFDGCGIERTPG